MFFSGDEGIWSGWLLCHGLIEVCEEVVDVFDTDGEADEFGFDATGELLFA